MNKKEISIIALYSSVKSIVHGNSIICKKKIGVVSL